eukprot:9279394-Alexandrium_andersonii.AAC.1
MARSGLCAPSLGPARHGLRSRLSLRQQRTCSAQGVDIGLRDDDLLVAGASHAAADDRAEDHGDERAEDDGLLEL